MQSSCMLKVTFSCLYNLIVYIFDSHENAKMLWSDGSNGATLDAPVITGKEIVVCHAFTASGLVESTLLICGNNFSEICTD